MNAIWFFGTEGMMQCPCRLFDCTQSSHAFIMVAGLARCKHSQVRERNPVLGLTHVKHG